MSNDLFSAVEEVEAIMSRLNEDVLDGFAERFAHALATATNCHELRTVHLPPEESASELETAREACDELAANSDQRAGEALAAADALADAAESLLIEAAGRPTPFSRHFKVLAAASDSYHEARKRAQ